MRGNVDVTAFKEALLEPDFALIDVPEELRERLLREGAVPSARLANA